jgi:hypothetical protein
LIPLIQSIIDCLHTISVIRHASNELRNLDYNKITILIVSILPTTFNNDIIFKLPPLSPSNPSSTYMQGMDKKYDGHAWSKVITTNIKNNFGLSFKKVRCLGHLRCVMMHYDCLVHFGAWNETALVRKLAPSAVERTSPSWTFESILHL